MRIKRSHLESLHFVVGTLLSCVLVVSVSSNLQAHPLIKMMEPQTNLQTLANDEVAACNRHPASGVEDVSVVEPEIAAALVAYTSPLTESVEDVMDDACARESSVGEEAAVEPLDSESLNALLTTIQSALNVQPEPKTCETLDPVFEVPTDFATQTIAFNK